MATSNTVSAAGVKTEKGRSPALLTRQHLLEGYAIVALPVFAWAIIAILREIPSWLLRLNIWDVIGMFFYGMAFALIESVIVLGVLVVVSLILPAGLYRRHFVPVTFMIILVTTMAFGVFHFNDHWIRQRAIVPLAIWGISWLAGLLAGWYFALKSASFQKRLGRLLPSLSSLAYVYVFTGVLGIVVVAARNLLG